MKYSILGAKEKITLNEEIKGDIIYVTVNWHNDTPVTPEEFGIRFSVPTVDTYSAFSPSMRNLRSLDRNYFPRITDARLASWMPLH